MASAALEIRQRLAGFAERDLVALPPATSARARALRYVARHCGARATKLTRKISIEARAMLWCMQRTPLTSSVLASAGYDSAARVLEIEFRSGCVYRYREVPEGVYEFLLRTPQKGSYFNRIINGRYPYEDVSPAVAQPDLMEALRASLGLRAELRTDTPGQEDDGEPGGAP